MKKLLLLFAAIVMASTGLRAQNYSVGDCFASNGLRYKITSLSPNTVEVTTVSDNAAQHYSMTEVNIPVNVTDGKKSYAITAIAGGSVSSAAFYSSKIKTIKFASGSQITEIGDYAFYKSPITAITLPASLATIGQRAFEGCTALADVTVTWTDDASIPTPGTNAFSGIVKGAVLHVPTGTEKLYKDKGWGQWFTIEAPLGTNQIRYTSSDGKEVTPYNQDAFGGANIVTNVYDEEVGKGCITFDRVLTSIGTMAFQDCSNLISITLPSGLTSIGEDAFHRCSNLTSITLPDGVTTIGERAFYECSSLTSIGLPNTLEGIGNRAFIGCSSLISITLPDGVKSIGASAFANCTSLSSVILSDELTTMGDQAFKGCTRLTSITLPGKLATMNNGGYHFSGCTNLSYAIFQGATPPTIDTSYNPFPGTGSNVGGTVLLVPSGTATDYEQAGFSNVYDTPTDEFKNKLLGNIATTMSGIKYPETISSAIDACKDDINSGTDVITIINAYGNAILTINLQKAKEPALTKIDELVTKVNSMNLDDKEEYLTILEAYRNKVINASEISEVEDAMSDVMVEIIPAFRLYAKKDLDNYLLANHIHNFSIESYLTRIDKATSEEAIDAIVNEAINDFDKTNHKVRIGDDWYVLNKNTFLHLGDDVDRYSLEDCPMVFPDAVEYVSDYEFPVGELHYSRDLTPVEGVWQCWCLPFDVTVDNTKFDAARIEGILLNANGETIVAFKKLADGATLHANKIYVIRAKAGKGKLELTLTDVQMYKPQSSTLVIQSAQEQFTFSGNNLPVDHRDWYTLNDKGQFSLRKATDTLKPQRFWLIITPREDAYYAPDHYNAKEFIDFTVLGDEEDVTGIGSLTPTLSEGKGVIYDLMGRKVTSIQKGQVYIVNGKKYIAK